MKTILNNPPYLQVAIDTPSITHVIDVLYALPTDERIVIEAGTPLIKRYGINIIDAIKEQTLSETLVVADLKTLDTGALEVQIAVEGGADAIVVSGLAPIATIDNVISEAENCGIHSIIDTLNIIDPLPMLARLEFMPNVVELHRAIDIEETDHQWGDISEIKAMSNKTLIAVAGGIQIEDVSVAIGMGADILVIGRAITGSENVYQTTEEFLNRL
jgi:bifunctional enzyme Fae/Hps